MNYSANPRAPQRYSLRRLFTTIVALCLPIVAATLFSGSFFRLGTLQPGEVLNVASAHAAEAARSHSHSMLIPVLTTGTTTSDTGLWNSGDLNQGQTFQYTFTAPGTYGYHCEHHNGMRGTITVTNGGGATPTPQGTQTAQPTGTAQLTGTAQATQTAEATGTAGATHTVHATGTAQATATLAPQVVGVDIQSYAYSPITVTVRVGDTVRWTNLDNDQHTVTSDIGLFDSGVLTLNQTWSHLFNTPGTYSYHCLVHGVFMTGYVVVQGATGGCAITFSDVPQTSPFYSYIRCLACRGIISGYNDGTFRLFSNVTRGQTAKIISNAAGYAEAIPNGQQTFSDVPSTNPFWVWIERIAMRSIISGYNCGAAPAGLCDGQRRPYFLPYSDVTRGQIAKIVAGAAGFGESIPSSQQTFSDVPNTNPFWMQVERVVMHGVISGYNCGAAPAGPCDPQRRPYFLAYNTATRGQTAKIVSNTFFPACSTP